MRVLALAASVAAIGGALTTAHAQSSQTGPSMEMVRAIVLPVGGSAGASERARVDAALRGALGDYGLERVESDCTEPACAPQALRAAGAQMAIGAALWPREGRVQVVVVLVDPEGREVSASSEEPSIEEASRSALLSAMATWASRAGRQVRVDGSPEGASIVVDREPWGAIPHVGRLAPGLHRFVVSATGYATERREVQVIADPSQLELRFDLRPEGGAGAGGDRSAIALGVGVPVIAVGVAVALVGVVGFAQGRACSPGATCPGPDARWREPDEGGNAAWIAAGSVVGAAGIAWTIGWSL